MKVIDLLNKIANGEDKPKKVRYDNQVFEYREDMLDYYCYDYDLNLMGYSKILNDEVEILEEEKEIPEKLDEYDFERGNQRKLAEKINEICDYLKSKGE